MKRIVACLVIVAGGLFASAEDAPPPRAVSEVQRLRKDERFAERGRVDLFVASTAAINIPPEDRRLWDPVMALGAKVVTAALLGDDRLPRGGPTWFGDFPKYCKLRNPLFVRADGVHSRPEQHAKFRTTYYHEVIQAAGVNAEGSFMGLVISRGPVSAKHGIRDSLILATGDVTASGISNSVVICDGDVVMSAGPQSSLIIARGKIEVKIGSHASTLIAGGTVAPGKVPEIRYPPPPNPNDPEALRGWKIQVAAAERFLVVTKEKDPNPLGLITFFELHRVGLDVKVADGVVRVAAVAAGSAGEKAGVKVGDTILDVNGKKPADAESLRRLLRDALAVGDATVRLQRGNDTLTVKLSLPE